MSDIIRIPTQISFGNRTLKIVEDITIKESANLSVALTLAAAGQLAGVNQETADNLIKDLDLDRLFSVEN